VFLLATESLPVGRRAKFLHFQTEEPIQVLLVSSGNLLCTMSAELMKTGCINEQNSAFSAPPLRARMCLWRSLLPKESNPACFGAG